jgi:hypothetical protein
MGQGSVLAGLPLLVCVAAYLAWRTRAAPILNYAASPDNQFRE